MAVQARPIRARRDHRQERPRERRPASRDREPPRSRSGSSRPTPRSAAQANAQAALYEEAARDPEAFWAKIARETVTWNEPFTTTLEWDLPFAKWFVGGKLNISENCVDRHVANGLGDKVAYHWIGEPGDTRTITYADLLREVQKAANALLELGIGTGDRVAIYMPMIPELPIAMLACARIGAPHTVVFAGLLGGGPVAAGSTTPRRSSSSPPTAASGAARRCRSSRPSTRRSRRRPTIEHVLMVRRLGDAAPDTTVVEGRDVWWHDIVDRQAADCPPVPLDSEHMLYLLYTSGSTAKPKGITHTTAGYLVGTSYSHKQIFDIKPDDVYWCAADIGWVTGHSYIVYGPLANATTGVLYEGSPDTPAWDRWWQIIEDYKVTILYCAPTAIRAFMKQGAEHPAKHDLSSLRVLGSVGEPINPEAWLWYREHIGGGKAPIVDTWWQTETGQILITPLPGVTTTKPGSATFPFPGIEADIVDGEGKSVPFGGGGYLVLKRPWPAMLRGIYGDPERYKETYWSRFPGMYFAGDGAKRDEDGYFWLLGRVDDVMNVSGPSPVDDRDRERARVASRRSPRRPSSAAPTRSPARRSTRSSSCGSASSRRPSSARSCASHVATKISPIAKPKALMFTPDLPKTRSGKIMRRLLRDIAQGRPARRHDDPRRRGGRRDDPREQLQVRGLTAEGAR